MKTSWRYLCKTSWRCLKDVSKTSWRYLEDDFARHLEDPLTKRLEDVLKTFWQDVLETSWKRLEDVLARRFEDVLKMYLTGMAKTNVLTKTSFEDVILKGIYSSWPRCLENVFTRRMFAVWSLHWNIFFVSCLPLLGPILVYILLFLENRSIFSHKISYRCL